MSKSKLKILEVNKFYYPHIGGIENVIKYTSEYFENKDDTEVKVLVCQEKGKSNKEIIDGVEVYRCSSLGTYFSCPLSFEFFRKFREMSKWADIIEIHTPFPLGDLATIISGYKGKVVIAWHSDIIRQKRLLKFYKPILMKFLKRADLIVVATKNHISSSDFINQFKEKCVVIPYGIEPKEYKNIKPYFFSDKLYNKNNLKIFFTGRLCYYKGVDILIDAFMKMENKSCELFIAGEGNLKESLINMVSNSDLENRIHFVGILSDFELKNAYADCDIFVLPSVENSEAFAIVQLEAMILGKPVINTSLPTGVPLVSLDKVTGITVTPGDSFELAKAIDRLSFDDKLRKEYGDNARKRALDLFTREKNNKALYDAFLRLIRREK